MTQIGEITLIARIDTSQYKRGADDIKNKNEEIEGSSDTASKKTSAVWGKVAKVGLAAVAAGFAVVATRVDDAVKRIDTLVAFPRVLQAMGASAGDAEKATDKLSDKLTGLPTPLQEGAQAVQKFVSAGLGVNKATDAFLGVNNALLATDASAQDTQVVMDSLQRVISAGNADASTMQAIMSRMPTVMSALSKETGKSQGELVKLFSEDPQALIDNLIRLNKDGGGGMASLEEQAREATGGIGTAFDNMGNAIDRGLESIVRAIGGEGGTPIEQLSRGQERISGVITNVGKAFGGTLATIGNFIPKMVELGKKVGEHLAPKLEALWNTVSTKLLPALNNLWKNVIQPMIPVIGTALVVAFGLAIDAINLAVIALTPLINFLGQNKDAVWAVIIALGAFKVAMMIGAAADAFKVAIASMKIVLDIYRTQGLGAAMAQTKLFRGLVMSPVAMPAIAVGAALASIYLVFRAVQAVIGAIKAMNDAAAAQDAEIRSSSAAIQSIQAAIKRARKAGNQAEVKRQQKRLREFTRQQDFATGGFTGRGRMNEVAGLVHKGEYVIPKSMVNQETGTPKMPRGDITVYQDIHNDIDMDRALRDLAWRIAS